MYFMRSGIIAKPEDLPKAKGIIAGSSAGEGCYMVVGAKELLGFPIERTALAYGGASDAARALMSGEVYMAYGGAARNCHTVDPFVKKGDVMALFQTGFLDEKGNTVKDPALSPDILTAVELYQKIYGKPPSGIAWDTYRGMVAAAKNYTRVLMLPPGATEGVVRAYWAAVDAMLKDREFLKVIEPLVGAQAVWLSGEALDKSFKLNFAIKPEVRDWLRATMPKYGVSID